jgi:cysteinyl-tRNA synthetase
MACDILGGSADIHTGGVDLRFPHHDNEIAQVEACYEQDSWVQYFLHAGHLTIEGCKMSKSLKNFITIKEALETHTAPQLRLAFLLRQWNSTLDYSENTMKEAIQFEKAMNEFFLSVKDLLRDHPKGREGFSKWTEREKQLNNKFYEKCSLIHSALCDSIDTSTVLKNMKELVSISYSYINEPQTTPNPRLLEQIAHYLTHLLKVFGVIPSHEDIGHKSHDGNMETNVEELILPYVNTLADFREKVRDIALENNVKPVLESLNCVIG